MPSRSGPISCPVKLSSAAAGANGAVAFVNAPLHRNTLRYASGSQWHPEKMTGCHLSNGKTSGYKNRDAKSFIRSVHFSISEVHALG